MVVMLRVTLAVCVPAALAIEIVPVHVVPAAIPDGLAETVKVVPVELAVKLPKGERVNQLLLVQLCVEPWAVALVLVCAVTVSVCDGGAAAPATAVNVREERLNVRDPAVAAVTLRV